MAKRNKLNETTDTQNLLWKVLEPIRKQIHDVAEKQLQRAAAAVATKLGEHDGRTDLAFKYPKAFWPKSEYMKAVSEYHTGCEYTAVDPKQREKIDAILDAIDDNDPNANNLRCECNRMRFGILRPDHAVYNFNKAADHAQHCLAGFVLKMEKKIEDAAPGKKIKSIRYDGTKDPWSYSHVVVVFADETSLVFKTKCIINCSVYGKLFNQWPTRIVK